MKNLKLIWKRKGSISLSLGISSLRNKSSFIIFEKFHSDYLFQNLNLKWNKPLKNFFNLIYNNYYFYMWSNARCFSIYHKHLFIYYSLNKISRHWHFAIAQWNFHAVNVHTLQGNTYHFALQLLFSHLSNIGQHLPYVKCSSRSCLLLLSYVFTFTIVLFKFTPYPNQLIVSFNIFKMKYYYI